MTRLLRHLCVVATVAVTLCGSVVLAGAASSGPTARPSLVALQAAIGSTLESNNAVNLSTTVPPLSSAGSLHSYLGFGHAACYRIGREVKVPLHPEVHCAFGDLKSRHLLVLTGDSQAWMWLAAFDAIGRSSHYRVVFLAKPGCAPWGNPNPPQTVVFASMTASDCKRFDDGVAAAIQTLHPDAVVPVGRSYPLANGNVQSPRSFALEVARLSTRLRPFSARLVYLTPFPRFDNATTQSPATCLAIHAGTPLVCAFSPRKLVNPAELAGLEAASHLKGVHLVDVRSLFCTTSRCALFVRFDNKAHLVYADARHMNVTYALWIESALSTLVTPAL